MAAWPFARLAVERDGIRLWDVRVKADPGRAWVVRCRVKNDHEQPKHVRLALGVLFLKGTDPLADDEGRVIAEWKTEWSVALGPRQARRISGRVKSQPQTRLAADTVDALADILSVSPHGSLGDRSE